MRYPIVEKGAFRIVGLKKRVPLVFQGINQEITTMWKSLDEVRINRLKACPI
jgi:AraC family transcriptional regulator